MQLILVAVRGVEPRFSEPVKYNILKYYIPNLSFLVWFSFQHKSGVLPLNYGTLKGASYEDTTPKKFESQPVFLSCGDKFF